MTPRASLDRVGALFEWREVWDRDLRSGDPLRFPGYRERLDEIGEESVRTGCTDHFVLIESRFEVFGGSMGVVAGERIVRAWDRAVQRRLPVVCITRSGGARMQEGMVSLVQLARTAAASRRHADAGLLSLAVYRSPTTGGVLASYGSLCDLRAAEVGATIGFAGPRVVEHTTGERVGEQSHTATRALVHGLIDAVLDADEIASWVAGALDLVPIPLPASARIASLAGDGDGGADRGAWAQVQEARREGRPTGVDMASVVCTSWTELGGADPTVRVGLATVVGRRAVVIASDRYAGSGRPGVAGFRLAQRGLALAARLGLPVVTLVDTAGADPSASSENEGIAAEIARTFAAMADLPTASVAVCVGEGGSGGALALAWADRLLMQRHAIFSVIGPEGAAVILERSAAGAATVAPLLKLTSPDLVDLGIADGIISEGPADLAAALVAALDHAVPGDRRRRADSASRRWLVE